MFEGIINSIVPLLIVFAGWSIYIGFTLGYEHSDVRSLPLLLFGGVAGYVASVNKMVTCLTI